MPRRSQRPIKLGTVYIITSDRTMDQVRIGFAGQIDTRMAQMKNELGDSMQILAALKGSNQVERNLHRLLKPLRASTRSRRHSWYWLRFPIPEIIDYMKDEDFRWKKCLDIAAQPIPLEAQSTTSFERKCREILMSVADAYGHATKLPVKAVSRRIYGHQDFLEKFRDGEVSLTLKSFGKLIDKFAANWPSNGDWPFLPAVIIERPKVVPRR